MACFTWSTYPKTISSSSLPQPESAIGVSVLDLDLGGDRQGEPVGDDGHVGHAEEAPEPVGVGDGGEGLAAAEDRARDDGGLRLQREAHEARAEVDERVALLVELRRAARALGEHHDEAVLLEEPLGVLGQAHELPRPREPEVHEGQPAEELLGHPLGEARRIHLEEAGCDDHRRVDGDAARVIADDHGPPVRGQCVPDRRGSRPRSSAGTSRRAPSSRGAGACARCRTGRRRAR